MKKVEEKEVYIKDEDVVIVGNIFTYEVSVFVYYDNYVCLVNTTLYESPIFIEKTIRSFFINPHTEIRCELYEAPLEFLLKENYESQTDFNQRKDREHARKAARSRTKKL